MYRRGLRSRNGGRVNKTGIETILRNPFYIGLIAIRRTGKTFEGAHEPLIAPSLFEAVQARKQGRHAKKRVRHDYTYRRLFRCGQCNSAMIPERQKGHVYYRCHTRSCSTKTVRETAIERDVLSALGGLAFAPGQISALETTLTERVQSSREDQHSKIEVANLGRATAKLDRLTDALVSGTIDEGTYRTKHRELLIEKAAIEERQRSQCDQRQIERTLGKFLELAKNLAGLYVFATAAEKRQIVELLFSNREIIGRNPRISPRSWLYDTQKFPGVLFGAQERT